MALDFAREEGIDVKSVLLKTPKSWVIFGGFESAIYPGR
jgi:hypothetical protein